MLTTAGRFKKPPFNPAAAYVAARDLRWGFGDGSFVDIPAGQPFDRTALNCDDWTAKRLYRVRQIAMVLKENGTPVLAAPEPETYPEPVKEPAQVEDPPEVPPAPDEPKPALSVKSSGFGRFTVIDARGNRVVTDRWLTKSEAEAIVAGA